MDLEVRPNGQVPSLGTVSTSISPNMIRARLPSLSFCSLVVSLFIPSSLTESHPELPVAMWSRPTMQDKMKDSFNSDDRHRLKACIRDNDTPQLQRLLDTTHAGYIHDPDGGWGTPLDVAVLCVNAAAVGLLLKAGANPLCEDRSAAWPMSALRRAAVRGNRAVFRMLWEHLSSDSSCLGFAAAYAYCLVDAAEFGRVSVLADLLDSWDGWSLADKARALHAACYRWQFVTADLLLARASFSPEVLAAALRVAVGFRFWLAEVDGPRPPPYHGVDYLTQQQLIARLFDAGAEPGKAGDAVLAAARYVDLAGALKVLLEKGADPDAQSPNGQVALHRLGSPVSVVTEGPGGALRTNEAGIRLLLQHGASVSRRDAVGNTPIHCAAMGSDLRIFRMYVSACAEEEQDELLKAENDRGETVMHWAAAGGKAETVEYLISRGLSVDEANDQGWTPFMCALAPASEGTIWGSRMKKVSDAVDTARLLLASGATTDGLTAEGWTPLHLAAMHLDRYDCNGMGQLAEEIISRGADVQGCVPVAIDGDAAVEHERERCRRRRDTPDSLRLRERLQMPLSRRPGHTTLHLAAARGAIGVVKALLAHGADLSAMDGKMTPARAAAESEVLSRGNQDVADAVVQLIVEAGGAF